MCHTAWMAKSGDFEVTDSACRFHLLILQTATFEIAPILRVQTDVVADSSEVLAVPQKSC